MSNDKNQTPIQCNICNRIFENKYQLSGHKRVHNQSKGKIFVVKCCCIYTRAEVTASRLTSYQNTYFDKQKSCKNCNKLFISLNKAVYCSHSCSAIANNVKRIRSEESKKRTSLAIQEHNRLHPKPKKPQKTKSDIFTRTCKQCNVTFENKQRRKYCSECAPLYMAESRNRFKFTFNVFKYPDLFDLDLLTQIGFYAPKGKSGRWNPKGLSRDHKVSVNEAIKNNYDPYYITHPINCELMAHVVNNRKKTKSSISYQELIKLVDEYDKRG